MKNNGPSTSMRMISTPFAASMTTCTSAIYGPFRSAKDNFKLNSRPRATKISLSLLLTPPARYGYPCVVFPSVIVVSAGISAANRSVLGMPQVSGSKTNTNRDNRQNFTSRLKFQIIVSSWQAAEKDSYADCPEHGRRVRSIASLQAGLWRMAYSVWLQLYAISYQPYAK